MPSTTIKSRISAFENRTHNAPSSPPLSLNGHSILEAPLSPMAAAPLQPVAALTRPSPSPSPPNLGRKTSLIDFKDWIVDDGPTPSKPTTNGFHIDATKTPTQQGFNGSKRQFSNVNGNGKLNGSTPLISLEASPPPKPKPKPKPANLAASNANGAVSGKPPQLPPRKPSYTSLKSASGTQQAFLYPPRRTDSLTVDNGLDRDPQSRNSPGGHCPSSSISSFHSVSLSSDTDVSTPGSVTNFISTFPMDQEHGSPPATNGNGNGRHHDIDSNSLSESYEEVTASSYASPATERRITLDWEKAMAKRKPAPSPPKLPDRPSSTRPSIKSPPPPSHPISRNASSASSSAQSSPIIRPVISAGSSSSTLATPPYAPRRTAPPPPPSRSSDRSSIMSTTTSHSISSRSSHSHASSSRHGHGYGGNAYPPSVINLKTKRPTPVPLAARKRYETVFNQNIIQRRRAQKQKENEKPALLSPSEARGRRAAGWRGLSVDLITGGEVVPPPEDDKDKDKIDEVVEANEKLEGAIVRHLWKKSGLDSARLAEIWNECDLTGQGALSLEAFVKGMWRIDEELRRTHAQTLKSAGSLGAYRSNSLRAHAASAPKLPQRPPRDLLR